VLEIRAQDTRGNLAQKLYPFTVRLGSSGDYETIVQQGASDFKKGEYTKALSTGRKAIRLRPEQVASYRLGIRAAAMYRNPLAVHWAEEIVQRFPQNAEAFYLGAQGTVSQVFAADTLEAYRKALERIGQYLLEYRTLEAAPPSSEELQKALWYFARCDFASSAAASSRVFSSAKNPMAWYLYELARFWGGESRRVRIEASRESTSNTGEMSLWGRMVLGLCYLQDGDPRGAQRIYRELLPLLKGYPEHLANAHVLLGSALLVTGEIQKASAELQTALQINPNSAFAHYVRAAALQAAYAPSEGVREELRKTLLLRPDFAEAWADLGYLYLEAQQTEWAQVAFDFARNLSPSSEYAAAGPILIDSLSDLLKARQAYQQRLSDPKSLFHHLIGAYMSALQKEAGPLSLHSQWLSEHCSEAPRSEIAKGDLKSLLHFITRLHPPFFYPVEDMEGISYGR